MAAGGEPAMATGGEPKRATRSSIIKSVRGEFD
jgi:hypothetical protein